MFEILRGYLCNKETKALVDLRVIFAHSILVAVRRRLGRWTAFREQVPWILLYFIKSYCILILLTQTEVHVVLPKICKKFRGGRRVVADFCEIVINISNQTQWIEKAFDE